MKQIFWISSALSAASLSIAACSSSKQTTAAPPAASSEVSSAVSKSAAADPAVAASSYWTCTMHPQIHSHDPGKCPICGMPLVLVHPASHEAPKVSEVSGVSGATATSAADTNAISVTAEQLKNAQISTYKVTRQDLETRISVSGRLSSSREVSFQVYESDLASVKVGSGFSGTASTAPGQVLKGRIRQVDHLIDPTSRTVRAVGSVEGSGARLSSESAFAGVITSMLKNQIVVPENAVLRAGTRDLVYVFSSDGKLHAREVQVGEKGVQQYQILAGLKEGEVISTGPNFLIDSEAKLRGQE